MAFRNLSLALSLFLFRPHTFHSIECKNAPSFSTKKVYFWICYWFFSLKLKRILFIAPPKLRVSKHFITTDGLQHSHCLQDNFTYCFACVMCCFHFPHLFFHSAANVLLNKHTFHQWIWLESERQRAMIFLLYNHLVIFIHIAVHKPQAMCT